MRSRLIFAVTAVVFSAGVSQASFFDAFDYPNGGLVANFGGGHAAPADAVNGSRRRASGTYERDLSSQKEAS